MTPEKPENPVWALICTISEQLYHFATVDNEIDAVARYSNHVARYKGSGWEDHRPHIFMVPETKWVTLTEGRCGNNTMSYVSSTPELREAFAELNIFRLPDTDKETA